jgi:hypothetical protein
MDVGHCNVAVRCEVARHLEAGPVICDRIYLFSRVLLAGLAGRNDERLGPVCDVALVTENCNDWSARGYLPAGLAPK